MNQRISAGDLQAEASPTNRRRIVASILVTVLVIGLLAFQLLGARVSSGRTIGIGISNEIVDGLLIDSAGPGLPADLAGLMAGDLITAIGGQRIHSVQDYDKHAAAFEPDVPVVFAVLRSGQGKTVEVKPGVPYPWEGLLPAVVGAFLYLGIAVLSLLQTPWDLRARLLTGFSLAVALELSLPIQTVGGPFLAVVVQIAFVTLTCFQVGVELHLAAVIPKPQPWLVRSRSAVLGFYLLGLALGLMVLVPLLVEQFGGSWLWQSVSAEALLFDIGMPVWALGVVALLTRSALVYPEARGRHQAALVLGGVLPWAAFVVATSMLNLLEIPYPQLMAQLEPLVLLCYPIAIFIAIFRYRLFDIELAVRRTLVYSGLTTALVIGFYLLIGVGGALLSRFAKGEGSVWAVAGATLILGLLFAPLRRWVEHLVYRRFFPERLELRTKLTELAAELPTLGKLPAMGRHLVDRLGEVFGIRWTTLMIADPTSGHLATLSSSLQNLGQELEFSLLLPASDPGLTLLSKAGKPFRAKQLYAKSPSLARRLQQLKATYLVPLTREDRLVGLFVLGPKSTGEEYQAEELELLNLLAHHVVTVFDNARLFESATRDSLTGLLRREMILDILDKELQRALRHARPLAIGMADLDHFKEINDHHGHLSGDAVLRWVSHTLQTGLRGTDFIGRYGGEEFLFVLPETDSEGAVQVAEKVRALVEERSLTTDEGNTIVTTVSIGLSAIRAGETSTALELIRSADRSLYEAKLAGRNRVLASLSSTG